MKHKYEIGDIVWDHTHKWYGVVLNNYGDPINGNRGEIRLDSDGNQPIRGDKGYNLVPYGSKGDVGGGDLTDLKQSALMVIPYNEDYYLPIYSKKLLK